LYGLSPEGWDVLCYLAVVAADRVSAREAFRHAALNLSGWPGWPGGHLNQFYLQVLPWIMAPADDSSESPGVPKP
jgi:hypothetical protein